MERNTNSVSFSHNQWNERRARTVLEQGGITDIGARRETEMSFDDVT